MIESIIVEVWQAGRPGELVPPMRAGGLGQLAYVHAHANMVWYMVTISTNMYALCVVQDTSEVNIVQCFPQYT